MVPIAGLRDNMRNPAFIIYMVDDTFFVEKMWGRMVAV